MSREDGFYLSKWWNLLNCSLKIVGSLHHMTADLGSLQAHEDLCTLPLSGHKICSPRALTSLHPDVLASFHYLCFLIPHHMPVTDSLDLSSLHVGSLPNTPLHFFPVFFLDQQNSRFSGPFWTPVLVSYCFAQWSCECPEVSFCPKVSQWELMSTLLFPACFIYNLKFLASCLLSFPPAFMLVSCSAYSDLQIEMIYSSEMSVDFQRTTCR
jgi:hypothetical protein